MLIPILDTRIFHYLTVFYIEFWAQTTDYFHFFYNSVSDLMTFNNHDMRKCGIDE
jgi:hypothetical protein